MGRLIYNITLLLFMGTWARAQQAAPACLEVIMVTTNTTTLVSGEKLLYSVSCVNADNRINSQIAYVEMIGRDGNIAFRDKVLLEDGKGSGEHLITADLKSDSYKLLAYTQWMSETPQRVFQADILIINPFQPNRTAATAIRNAEPPSSNQITTTKTVYDKREKVFVRLPKTEGNFSVSVRKKDNLPVVQSSDKSPIIFNPQNRTIVPELRGEIISGQIKRNGMPATKGIGVALSAPGNPFAVKVVETLNDGRFIFTLDKPVGNQNIVIQVLGNAREEYAILMDTPISINVGSIKFADFPKLFPELRASVESRSTAAQVESAYKASKPDSIMAIPKQAPFYDPISKEYNLDDFTRFHTVRETIIEVVQEAFFKQNANGYRLFVRDHSDQGQFHNDEDALVLVDGLILQNVNALFDYPAASIQKINVVPGLYQYGPKRFNGIISVITKQSDFNDPTRGNFIVRFDSNRPQQKIKRYEPDYSKTSNVRIPDLRYQLYWAPHLKSESEISFYASDLSGTYTIILEGYDSNGRHFTYSGAFDVR